MELNQQSAPYKCGLFEWFNYVCKHPGAFYLQPIPMYCILYFVDEFDVPGTRTKYREKCLNLKSTSSSKTHIGGMPEHWALINARCMFHFTKKKPFKFIISHPFINNNNNLAHCAHSKSKTVSWNNLIKQNNKCAFNIIFTAFKMSVCSSSFISIWLVAVAAVIVLFHLPRIPANFLDCLVLNFRLLKQYEKWNR